MAPTIDDSELRWLDGFSWSPEGCGRAGAAVIECAGNSSLLDAERGPGAEAAQPIYLWAADTCSTIGYQGRDWLGLVRRSLEAEQSFLLATELWSGDAVTAEGYENQFLSSSDAVKVTTGELAPVEAFAVLDANLTRCLRNRQGMIHVTPDALAILVQEQAVWLSGTLWLSPNGHIIVADAGYDGSAPTGTTPDPTTQWAYGTDLIYVRLGPVATVPTDVTSPQQLAQVVDRETNDLTVWAGRFASWQWDHCCHLAAEIDSPVTTLD